MRYATLLITILGSLALAACVSGRPKQDTYTSKSGQVTVIENGYESCSRSCNEDYARCGDADSTRKSIDATQKLFGGAGACSSSLSSCMSRCAQDK